MSPSAAPANHPNTTLARSCVPGCGGFIEASTSSAAASSLLRGIAPAGYQNRQMAREPNRVRLATLTWCLLAGCGSSAALSGPLPQPDASEARLDALRTLGSAVFAAARAGDPRRLLASDADLQRLLEATAAEQLRPARAAAWSGPVRASSQLAPIAFASACMQRLRHEGIGGELGLQAAGWVVDRVLVEGRRADGARVGAWVAGAFVYTSQGFVALTVSELEELRWEHADLELAVCDVRVTAEGPVVSH